MRDSIHAMDDEFLINRFHVASEQSADDEWIQLLLGEILERELTIEEVWLGLRLH
ncbi:sporulation histidine kinase inhibitor Sda [Cohnella boryungensis]|uniref:Sporulation histidine kinase inhibitor Sda n=1 Tax=Cohnella boryungensis TaxID=768479 RepID=A0ABV8S7Z4_9BACL